MGNVNQSGFNSGKSTDNPTNRKIIRLSIDPNFMKMFFNVSMNYSPKNDRSIPTIMRKEVATIPSAIPIINALDPAVVG